MFVIGLDEIWWWFGCLVAFVAFVVLVSNRAVIGCLVIVLLVSVISNFEGVLWDLLFVPVWF